MTRWSQADIARLRALSQTHTMREAAVELGRSYNSVTTKMRSEGITWQRFERPRWESHRTRIVTQEANGVVYETLTRKEHAILVLAAHGMSNDQIAAKLWLPVNSVHRCHMPALATKLHATDKLSSVVMALKLGIICLDEIRLSDVLQATYERQEANSLASPPVIPTAVGESTINRADVAVVSGGEARGIYG